MGKASRRLRKQGQDDEEESSGGHQAALQQNAGNGKAEMFF